MTIVVLDEEYPEYALSQQEVVPVTVQPPRAASIYSIEDRFVPRSHALTSLSPTHQVHPEDDPEDDYPEDGHEPGSRFTVKHEQTEYEYIVKGTGYSNCTFKKSWKYLNCEIEMVRKFCNP